MTPSTPLAHLLWCEDHSPHFIGGITEAQRGSVAASVHTVSSWVGELELGFNWLCTWILPVSTGRAKGGKGEQPHKGGGVLWGQPRVGASLSHLEHAAGSFLTYSVRSHLPLGLKRPNYISFWLPQMPHFSSPPIAHPPPSLQWLQSPASASKVHDNSSKGLPGSLLTSAIVCQDLRYDHKAVCMEGLGWWAVQGGSEFSVSLPTPKFWPYLHKAWDILYLL